MSMQRIHNYGSSLQAYGLKRLIEALDETLRVEFVDYTPGPPLRRDPQPRYSTSRVFRGVSKAHEYNVVDTRLRDKLSFLNHKITYGKRYFPILDIPEKPNYDLDVDVQVIGSDEVFNCVQSNTNVGFSRDLFGHRTPAGKLVSYAASFGNTTIEKIDEFGIRNDLAEALARFQALSVRDLNSAEIITELTGRIPEMHIDPALAYDFSQLVPKRTERSHQDGKYIVVYGYSGRFDRSESDSIRRYAQLVDAGVICLGGVQTCCDRFIDCNPLELLAYFRDADAIVTDTFHGVVFSIASKRPFGAIIRRSVGNGYGNEEKVGHLLDTLGVRSQQITDIAGIESTLGKEIDYDSLSDKLRKERNRTRDYLRSAIL